MGACLAALSIENIDERLLEHDQLTLEKQSYLSNFDKIRNPDLGEPSTRIKFDKRRAGNRCFRVRMKTETKETPIYVNTNPPQIVENYQEIREFSFWISEDRHEIYVFAPKAVVNTFVNRLESDNWIEAETIYFNFRNLSDLDRLISARGTWEDSKGSVKRVARFGKDIEHKMSDQDFEATTTFYIDYRYRSLKTQLVLNRNGRISTNEDLSNQELYEIYSEISPELLASEKSSQSEENHHEGQNCQNS
jgi:hypothetical protein